LLEFPAGGSLVVLIKVDVGLDNQSRGEVLLLLQKVVEVFDKFASSLP